MYSVPTKVSVWHRCFSLSLSFLIASTAVNRQQHPSIVQSAGAGAREGRVRILYVTPTHVGLLVVSSLSCFGGMQVVLFIPNFIGKTSDARAVLKDTVSDSEHLACYAQMAEDLDPLFV